jgi:hypothetical protein
MPFRTIWRCLIIMLVVLPLGARAQQPGSKQPGSEQPLLKAEELDALVAPIALYPDPLLAEILIASTYPLEVVQADRWLRHNKHLKEDGLKSEADKQSWDNSIKSLVGTSSVLEMMSTRLDWTQKLGNAVLAQQSDVMSAIQRLRSKAYDNGKLASTKEQTVTVEQAAGNQIVAIEPATPDVISVPYYDPTVVYAPWPYSDYPPYYFATPAYIPAEIVRAGIAFGAGYLLGRWTAGGNFWGGGFHWNRGDINVNRPINIDRDRVTHWQHNPRHRHGVQYNNAIVRQRFTGSNTRPERDPRANLRSRTNEALKPGTERRSKAEQRPAKRKDAAGRSRQKSAAKRASRSRAVSQKAKRTAHSRGKAHRRARTARGRSHRNFNRPAQSRRFTGGGFRGGGGRRGGRRR